MTEANSAKRPCFLGIDVGTGSARAAVIDHKGNILGLHVTATTTWNPRHEIYQQSTDNIWAAICQSTAEAIKKAGTNPEDIKGVGFDATCSLAVLDREGNPMSVDVETNFEDNTKNIILWADHRANEQASRINATNHPVLKYVGDKISLEMEVPKMLWLKENMPAEKWQRIGHFFDLPDLLTFKATGSLERSTCSLTCKCSFVPPGIEESKGWNADFFKAIGLQDFVDENFERVGGIPDETGKVLFAGDKVGSGLSAQGAKDLGLLEGTPVGSGVIDAYAGAIATLGASTQAEKADFLGKGTRESMLEMGANRLAIICGTSSCHIAMAPGPIFVPGVWGPYKSVLLPTMWCAEGGQSSTGQLIDHILSTHAAYSQAQTLARSTKTNIYALLNQHLVSLAEKRRVKYVELLVKDLHIYPDYHGNRSPLADPSLRGVLVGQSLDASLDDLALKYYATLQAISCQTRHILESLNSKGYTIDTLCLSGGLCKNDLFVKLHADITRCKVVLPESIEGAVVIGAAFLGAKAAGLQPKKAGTSGKPVMNSQDNERQPNGGMGDKEEVDLGLWDVMVELGNAGKTVHPTQEKELVDFCERKYKVFHMMLEDQKKYRNVMNGDTSKVMTTS
ncbi:hypothetical protein BZG36_04018 [Bifiguratus adelaidae]|uniref:FGGY carbohydrate kinase domain-containing protein n=1 Tax=Bifiguratus adelaidae TaxID=1938954 RepID=A0A261XYP9_9FUNG|nr:hypothetical protein BZG36_04018 [Bifiguratus adelaidae]